ncbi:MAG: alpha/beta hydrolase [Gemmatimonadaceae bacterium]
MAIPAPRESGFTTTTEEPLYWAAYGPQGARRLLVLHGGPGAHHDYLLPQMLHLARRYDVLFYDQRGGGRSRAAAGADISAATHVADLAAIIAEFSIDPVSIVGYSWGGMLALLYLLETRRDASLRLPASLALIDPAPLARDYRRLFEKEFATRQDGPRIRAIRDELEASGIRETDPAAYRARTFELAVAPYFADPGNAVNLTPFRVTGRVMQSVWSSLGAEYNLISELQPAHCPTLFVHGRDDPIPLESSIEGAEAMSAELVLLDDCGHVPYVEQPGRLFAALDKFLAAQDPQ